MWHGTVGPGVAVEKLTRPGGGFSGKYRFFLREDPDTWIEGGMVDATLTHGFAMTFAQWVTATITHPAVVSSDTTAWPPRD
ncbi:hypothetical protein G4H71_16550 [Rhodococcus triatomae]|uniref:Uncharacterized protein n=1 Tax=Rhodococcus triatomae TaxID=300028 RepID=A0A1G8JQC5_9NOCA|nr:hypothetical protein [Rhodococcus triatomae]QNG19658.1 hypothetical protein G4H72_13825 [Rhodococcus triatomae]QNG24427.1 hypothetical protein G4H71_16550 [Rhodococcus triatomae]SDI33489.1 hypothetical protein SAMN05444695_106260 [Rhodococcus triatomae]